MKRETEIGGETIQEVSGKESQDRCEVAIIGAGPYGLSAGAHLRAEGMSVRVFGEPMEFWAKKMPEGMLLRSPRVASTISDAVRAFTLEAYETSAKIPPSAPLPLDTFVGYGKWFRHQLESDLDERKIARVDRDLQGFRLTTEDGQVIRSHRVVVAAGIGPFRRKPPVFQSLPEQYASHCYEGRDVHKFAGKRVAVIGAGQSALEWAALLHEADAKVEIVVREPRLRWIGMHKWLHQLGPISAMLYSRHDIGPIGLSRLVAYPKLVGLFPLKLRDKIRTRAVRSAGSPWLIDRLAKVKVSAGRIVTRAAIVNGEVILTLDDNGERRVDHVLMGTGYDVDISRYDFLPPELVNDVQVFNGYPRLRGGFQSSVPGLHFIGATAARSFGPLLYFVTGTEFASKELTSHIIRHKQGVR